MTSFQSEAKINFKEHLLKRRLGRVPKDFITEFWEEDIDFENINNQKYIVDRLITEYQIKHCNPQFIDKFKDFLRDAVLTAREADYLISISKPKNIIDWIKSWENNNFNGQQNNFKLHTVVELNQKYLKVDKNLDKPHITGQKLILDGICFPTTVIFVVSSSHNVKTELNGLEEISYYPTTEFEIILRKDLDIVEVRGSYQVVKDFVSTAILDKDNPLSAAESYFIGDKEDTDKKKSLTKIIRQIIKIDTLKNLLDGAYRNISSPFPGSKVSKFDATLEDLKTLAEETHPEAQAVLEEMMKHPVKGNISFYYKNKEYSFSVTKTGGLLFREYIPEEVVTYILYNVKLSGYAPNGS